MRPELLVPGARWARLAADGVAVAGLVSFVAAFWFDAVVVALFALVLLGITVPRVARLPGPLQVATGVTILIGAWAATLDWYVAVSWLDLVIHTVMNALLAVVGVLVMRRLGWLPRRLHPVGTVVLAAGLGAVLAVLWEVGEWVGYTFISDEIGVGYDDTIGDLAWATLGSLGAGLLLVASERSRDG